MGNVIKSVAGAVLHVLLEVLLLGIHYSLCSINQHTFLTIAILCFFSARRKQQIDSSNMHCLSFCLEFAKFYDRELHQQRIQFATYERSKQQADCESYYGTIKWPLPEP
jgi:hypothetical protein